MSVQATVSHPRLLRWALVSITIDDRLARALGTTLAEMFVKPERDRDRGASEGE